MSEKDYTPDVSTEPMVIEGLNGSSDDDSPDGKPIGRIDGLQSDNEGDPALVATHLAWQTESFNLTPEYLKHLRGVLLECFKERFEGFLRPNSSDIKLERRYRRYSFANLLVLAGKPFDKISGEHVIELLRQRYELAAAKRVSGRGRPKLPVYEFTPNTSMSNDLVSCLERLSPKNPQDLGAQVNQVLDLIKETLFYYWRDRTSGEDRFDFFNFPKAEYLGLLGEIKDSFSHSRSPNKDFILKRLQLALDSKLPKWMG